MSNFILSALLSVALDAFDAALSHDPRTTKETKNERTLFAASDGPERQGRTHLLGSSLGYPLENQFSDLISVASYSSMKSTYVPQVRS